MAIIATIGSAIAVAVTTRDGIDSVERYYTASGRDGEIMRVQSAVPPAAHPPLPHSDKRIASDPTQHTHKQRVRPELRYPRTKQTKNAFRHQVSGRLCNFSVRVLAKQRTNKLKIVLWMPNRLVRYAYSKKYPFSRRHPSNPPAKPQHLVYSLDVSGVNACNVRLRPGDRACARVCVCLVRGFSYIGFLFSLVVVVGGLTIPKQIERT